jgi:hypothetical protein
MWRHKSHRSSHAAVEGCEASVAERYPARTGQEAFAQPAARGKQDADDGIANIGEPAAPAFHGVVGLYHAASSLTITDR